MMNAPEKSFGFEYEHNGRRFMFDLPACSKEEAEARLASMARALCVGQISAMKETEQSTLVTYSREGSESVVGLSPV